MEHKIAIIVDGYRFGGFYVSKLKRSGFDCVHVQSSPDIPLQGLLSSLQAENYLENIIFHDNIDALLNQLKKYAPIAFVLPGHDSGVALADLLNEKLQLPFANVFQLSAARRNKFIMGETIKKAGLNAAKQIVSDNLEDIVDWAEELHDFPVILKPLESACTNYVIFCHNEKEIIAAFQKMYGKYDIFGTKINHVLAQKFLRGTEYIVNTVSFAGKHYVTDIWVYKKTLNPDDGMIYIYAKILPYAPPYAEILEKYTFQVLDAVGMQYGVAHNEIMLTAEGPAIIEIAARPMGAVPPDLITTAVGHNHMDLQINSLIDEESFQKQIAKPYQLKKHLMIVLFIAQTSGTIKEILHLDEIKKLRSFHSIKLSVKVGGQLQETIDLLTSPGSLYLLHEDEQALQNDYEQVLAWEKNMFVV